MTTKEKILETALELYNQQGVNAVTSRHIAAAMGISAGNLHYHFPHTDDIIKALYDNLSASFDQLMLQMGASPKEVFLQFREAITLSFELQYRYRFIFLHFVEISLRIPSVKKEYAQLIHRRHAQFMGIFRQLMKEKIFRADIPDEIWDALISQLFIMADFWLSNNELTAQLKGKKAIRAYSAKMYAMFYSYLTKPAQAKFVMEAV